MLVRLKKRVAARSPSIYSSPFVSYGEAQHCPPPPPLNNSVGSQTYPGSNFNNTWLHDLLTKKQQVTAQIQMIIIMFKTAVPKVQLWTVIGLSPSSSLPSKKSQERAGDICVARRAASHLQGRLLQGFAFLGHFPQFWTAFPHPLHFPLPPTSVTSSPTNSVINEFLFAFDPGLLLVFSARVRGTRCHAASPSSSCSSPERSFCPRRWHSTRVQLNSHWHRCQPSHSHQR